MATRMYLGRHPQDVAVTPDAGWEKAVGHLLARLTTVRRGFTQANTTIAAQGTSGNDTLLGQWVSRPLAGAQTIAGTLKGQTRMLESAAALDARAQIVIRVVSGNGVTVRGTLLAMDTGALASELATSATNRKNPRGGSQTLTSVNAQDGDRIVVEVGARQHATAAGNLSLTTGDDQGANIDLRGDTSFDLPEDETTTTALNPWVEFSQTLVFVTRLWLGREHSQAPTIAPSGAWERTPAGYLVYRATPVPTGLYSNVTSTLAGNGATDTDTLLGQWISAPLDVDQTITGNLKGQMRVRESASGSDSDTQLIVRVIKPDGTARGTLLAENTAALSNEWSTTLTNRKLPKGGSTALSSVNALAGDRIVIELGARRHTATNSSYDLSVGDAATSDLPEDEASTSSFNPWVEFTQRVTFEEENTALVTEVRMQSVQQAVADALVTEVRMQTVYALSIFDARGSIEMAMTLTGNATLPGGERAQIIWLE